MFIYSIRATTLKFFASLLLVVTVLAVLVALGTADSVYASADGKEINYSGIKTNEDRVAFIESFGIKVKPTPITEETFTMPLEINNLEYVQSVDFVQFIDGQKITLSSSSPNSFGDIKLEQGSLFTP